MVLLLLLLLLPGRMIPWMGMARACEEQGCC
eukprot:SAG31_NODE_27302_length_428_cov_0.863222_1_plen_30_part_10